VDEETSMDQDRWEYREVVIRDDQDRVEELSQLAAEGWEEVGSEPYFESQTVPRRNPPRTHIMLPAGIKKVKVGETVRLKRRKH
jgi:predicted RNA-binding protein